MSLPSRRRRESRDEKAARECFGKHLLKSIPADDVDWRVVDDDPPDYTYTICGVRYSVEATSLYDLVEAGRKRVPSANMDAMARKLEAELRKACAERGILRGFYILQFERPTCSAKERKLIVKPALDYVARTAAEERPAAFGIWPPPKRLPSGFQYQVRSRPLATIEKFSTSRDLLQVLQPNRGAWVEQAQQEAVTRLGEMAREKARRLAEKGVAKPWILLVLHMHPFVEPRYYLERLSEIQGREQFHSIFVAGGCDDGYFLHGPWQTGG